MPDSGFKNLQDYKNRMREIPEVGGRWIQGYINPNERAPSWAPTEILYYFRNVEDVLRRMIGDTRLATSMKWAPEKLFNSKNERLYSELWTGDWWWRTQVH